MAELDRLNMNEVSVLLRDPWEAVGEACGLVPALDTFWRLGGLLTSGYARFEPRDMASQFDLG